MVLCSSLCLAMSFLGLVLLLAPVPELWLFELLFVPTIAPMFLDPLPRPLLEPGLVLNLLTPML